MHCQPLCRPWRAGRGDGGLSPGGGWGSSVWPNSEPIAVVVVRVGQHLQIRTRPVSLITWTILRPSHCQVQNGASR